MGLKRKAVVIEGQKFTFSITPEQLTDALMLVEQYSLDESMRRMDDVFKQQPALLGAIIHLPRHGVSHVDLDPALRYLLILFECFTRNVPSFPTVPRETVQKALDDIAAMLRFYDGETPKEADRLQKQSVLKHQEQAVLAFLTTYCMTHFKKQTGEHERLRNACLAITNACLEELDRLVR